MAISEVIRRESQVDLESNQEYLPPTMSRFWPQGVGGPEVEFLYAPDLTLIAEQLIDDCAELGHLKQVHMEYLWRGKGGKSGGRLTCGKCVKTSGLVKFFSDATWVIWLAADHCATLHVTRRQVEAMLYHELLHAGEETNDDGQSKPVAVGHDAEMFIGEIQRYGAWQAELQSAAQAFSQPPLFEDGDK